jgi:LemA protein
MKRPRLSLIVFSTVFFGIILFSVIFGSYSSLYRAQNRVQDSKVLVIAECQKQLNLLPELISMARETKTFNVDPNNSNQGNLDQAVLNHLDQTATEAKAILTRINPPTPHLEKEMILTFEQSQIRLSQEIIGLIKGIKKDKHLNTTSSFVDLEKKFNDLEITVFYTGTKYNKEVRYFNQRKAIFPGFLIAKLFGLENIQYFEITTDLFKPERLRS